MQTSALLSYGKVCGKALNCLDVGGESSALIVAGGSDPVLRIWDPRKPGTVAPIFQFSSHSSRITACKWHWPLATIDSHKDKVLTADWWKDDSIISGGADSKLCIYSGMAI
ncbi:putative Ribosome biogenesis protein WDR12 [Cocos nucifera]|nr:putative Ribosome biogenesis protein WDR12 [Cocos nucifera]